MVAAESALSGRPLTAPSRHDERQMLVFTNQPRELVGVT